MDSSKHANSAKKLSVLRFAADPNEFCSSPFVNKLEALLKFSGYPVQVERGDIMKMPRKLLPALKIDEEIVPDSEFAYDTCVVRGIAECLDYKVHLTDKEQAITIAIRALVETNLVEAMSYERWIEHWYETRDLYLVDIPAMVRPPVAYWLVYRPTMSRFYGTGYARLSDEERRTKVKKEIDALSAFVPSTGYILGKSAPTRIDACVHGFLSANLRCGQLVPRLIEEIYRHDNLIQYYRRITAEFWPERKQLA
ncbi:related to glutathione S-transferase, putative-Talaromyces stipitatus [Serendipita indica DSM 11827]|uniref:Related to glutathione S-transferase, putative-Talaromyces stipitatus n=1 Tax=Serendipita indica (strain DSM 11827) TaxID=1109443 RepID=G4TBG4_SERID|nr:related to glutathione S-transferase, putative-Talaromyces stipitatus [Serendipita indica DSM 11827]